MKGLDTNVLIRYLVQDDPQQSTLASSIIEKIALQIIPVIYAILFCVNWSGCWKAIISRVKMTLPKS